MINSDAHSRSQNVEAASLPGSTVSVTVEDIDGLTVTQVNEQLTLADLRRYLAHAGHDGPISLVPHPR